MIIALAILLAAGAKEFAIVNKLFTGMVCFEILIYLDVEKALADGIKLFRSANNVILSPGINGIIPAKYFLKVVDRRYRGNVIFTNSSGSSI